MAGYSEPQAAAKWLYALLAADAGVTALVGTRIAESLQDQGAALPYIVYSLSSSFAVPAAGDDRRIVESQLWLVQAVAEGGSFAEADAILRAVDAVLRGVSSAVVVNGVTYTVTCSAGEDQVRYVEDNAGRMIRHVGRYYRLRVNYL